MRIPNKNNNNEKNHRFFRLRVSGTRYDNAIRIIFVLCFTCRSTIITHIMGALEVFSIVGRVTGS